MKALICSLLIFSLSASQLALAVDEKFDSSPPAYDAVNLSGIWTGKGTLSADTDGDGKLDFQVPVSLKLASARIENKVEIDFSGKGIQGPTQFEVSFGARISSYNLVDELSGERLGTIDYNLLSYNNTPQVGQILIKRLGMGYFEVRYLTTDKGKTIAITGEIRRMTHR